MQPLLDVRNLTVEFRQNHVSKNAVFEVTFSLDAGESLAVIGESGSGKSTLALAITNVLPANATITSGEIIFRDVSGKSVNITELPRYSNEMRRLRGQGGISIIFQEPSSSLNQVYTVGWQLAERLIQSTMKQEMVREKIYTMLREMGFPDPVRVYNSYPFQLSGGMNQRIMIAMALLSEPRLLICDEPTSALDVTTQAQVLGLLVDLKKRYGFAMIFITHNIDVARFVATNVLVLYKGIVMEKGSVEQVIDQPLHPYTQYLKESVMAIKNPQKVLNQEARLVKATPIGRGCPFSSKCQHSLSVCSRLLPPYVEIAGRVLRCWLHQGV